MSPFSRFGEDWRRRRDAKAAGVAGRDFFNCALQWCNEHRSDGFLPADAVRELAPGQRYPSKAVQALLDIGWLKADRGGYVIPREIYTRHNLLRADLDAADRRASRTPPPAVHKPVDIRAAAPGVDAGSNPRSTLAAGSMSARCCANSDPAHTCGSPPISVLSTPSSIGSHETEDARARTKRDDPPTVENLLEAAARWEEAGRPDKARQRFDEAVALERATRKPLDRASGHAEAPGGAQDERSQGPAKEETA